MTNHYNFEYIYPISKSVKKDRIKSTPIKQQAAPLLARRGFLKTILAGTVAVQVPWWVNCTHLSSESEKYVFNQQQKEVLLLVQDFLFPSDNNGPGALELNALNYLQWVILDPEKDPDEIQYLFNGIGWVEETAEEENEQKFLKLDKETQWETLTYIADQAWGKSWYSVLLTYIFEALLSDPIYGSNSDGIGWKWLHHNPGQPRPNNQLKYGQFLKYVNTKKQA
ncbi:MAG: gluconate 2-dehydrogenase subunit 3 family protein [Bacteroidales bacterium]|nr:gluconate 2-dehydrogenase subunit 3 family protein [Bacteroidales bacterium]